MKTIIKYDFWYLSKTAKFIVMGVLALFLALLSVITAKYMNAIMELAFADTDTPFTFPDPTSSDSYIQFFGNFNDMYLWVIIFVSVAFFTHDYTKNHLPLILSKPFKRSHYILSKSILISGTLLIVLLITGLLFGFYTYLLFGSFASFKFLISLLAYYIYLLIIIHAGLFFMTITRSYIGPVGLSFGVYFMFLILSIFEFSILKYFPFHLIQYPLAYLLGEVTLATLLVTMVSGLVLVIGLLFLSVTMFRKKVLMRS